MKHFKLSFIFKMSWVLICSLSYLHGYGQDYLGYMTDSSFNTQAISCGADGDIFLRGGGGISFAPSVTVSSFPDSAIFTCGKIDVYYEDVHRHFHTGFDDTAVAGSTTLGAQRRETMCAVLTYIQSVLDFSNIPNSTHVRLYIDTSYAPIIRPSTGLTIFGYAYPLFDSLTTGIKKGYLNEFVTGTGSIDPCPGQFHGFITMNFDRLYINIIDTPLVHWHNDYTAPFVSSTSCQQSDLFSCLLHEVCHAMGWFSLIGFPTGGANNGLVPHPKVTTHHVFSGLDYSFRVGHNVYPLTGLTKFISGTIASPYLDLTLAADTFLNSNNYWLNDSAPPKNHPVYSGAYGSGSVLITSYLSHLEDQPFTYTSRERISPGDQQEYVMGPFLLNGVLRRTYSKGELQSLVDILGYKLTTTYDSANPHTYHNHTPFSKRMAEYGINTSNYGYFTETLPPDDTLTNNTGASIIVSIPAMVASGDLTDADPGDTALIYLDSTTLVNLRGCGIGGNNHLSLRVSPDSKHITYTPRPNFYGKAQMGFNITDGKERGSYVVVTIEVYKGSNVSCARGANMVCNPGFEEGSEIKILGSHELVQNGTAFENGIHEGRWQGICFSDSHPYCFNSDIYGQYLYANSGIVVGNSDYSCGTADTSTSEEGTLFLTSPHILHGSPIDNPLPDDSGGHRYQLFSYPGGSYYYLADSARNCQRYKFEFDIYSNYESSYSSLPIKIGFADHLVNLQTSNPDTSFNYIFYDTVGRTPTDVWTHLSLPIHYCGIKPSNILYFSYGIPNTFSQFDLDNLSLKQDTSTPPPFHVNISQTALSGCFTQLKADTANVFCGVSFTWSATAKTMLYAITDTVASDAAATYSVSVSDGCRDSIATSSISRTAPGPITGPDSICTGLPVLLHDSGLGGTWTSSNTSVATIGLSTGLVSGVNPGTVIITYTYFCSDTFYKTIRIVPSAIATASTGGPICTGVSLILRGIVSSGTGPFTYYWTGPGYSSSYSTSSTSETTVVPYASIGTYSLIVTNSIGCPSALVTTVASNVPPITGPSTICSGQSTTLTDSITGGTWSTGDTSIAKITYLTGVVTGTLAGYGATGTTTVIYTLSTGCSDTAILTVDPAPAPILGTRNLCTGATTLLTDSTIAFSPYWWSSNALVATVPIFPGLVTGVSPGTATIYYINAFGCYTDVTVTVEPMPAAISGTRIICDGTHTTLSDSLSGGIWSSNNLTIATIGSGSGIVNGVSSGTVTISYTVGICSAIISFTVIPAPTAIAGALAICVGSSETLTDTITGGTWRSSNTSVASIGSSSGILTGVSAGTAVITYTIGDGCFVYIAVTINPIPAVITGGTSVCAGSQITLGDGTSGGTWHSSNSSVAIIGSSSGVLSGVSSGTAIISYTISGGCYVTTVIMVNPVPALYTVTGGGSYCAGGIGELVGLTGSVSGISYKLYDGSTLISTTGGTGSVLNFGYETSGGTYKVVAVNSITGCLDTMLSSAIIVVNPTPVAISGTLSICPGTATTLTDATSGGAWSSSNTAVATVGSSTGIVSGVSSGTAIITYNISGCFTTAVVTVYPGSGSGACTPCSYFTSSFSTIGTSGSITSSLRPGNYYIPNSVTVYGIDTFRDATIIIAAGDTINVDTLGILTIDSSHILSCSMWEGMALKPGHTKSGRLNVIGGSLIEDAMVAVYIPKPITPTSGYVLDCDNAIFNRNVTGIALYFYTSLNSSYPFLVRNTVITGRDFSGVSHYPYSWPPTNGTGGLKNPYYDGNVFDPPFYINYPSLYPGVACKNGAVPWNGLLLDSVGADTPNTYAYPGVAIPTYYSDITIGDTTQTTGNKYMNLFDNLVYGINAKNSNVSVVNNAFTYLDSRSTITLTGPGVAIGGDGVYATAMNDDTNHNRLRVYTPPGSIYHNLFYNFANGVECYNYFQIIGQYNYMICASATGTSITGSGGRGPSSAYGFLLKSAKYDKIDISYDTISNVNTGIAFWALQDPGYLGGVCCTIPPWQYSGVININGNIIQAHPHGFDSITTQKVSLGISVQNVLVQTGILPVHPGIDTQQLNIISNFMYDVYNGIYVNNFWRQFAFTYENGIYVKPMSASPKSMQYGINHTHCSNSLLTYNFVTESRSAIAAHVPPLNDSLRGIYGSSNSKMTLGCNTTQRIGRGFEFFIGNPMTDWHDNVMDSNLKGMVLNAGVIGPQVGLTAPSGNSWTAGSWAAGTWQTYVINGNANSSPLYVTGSLGTPSYPSSNTGHIIPYIPGFNIFNATYTTAHLPCWPIVIHAFPSSLYEQMAQQEVPYGYALIPNNWMGQFKLWEAMLIDSSMADSSNVLYVFDSMAQNSRFAFLTDIETQIAQGNFDSAKLLMTLNIDSMANASVDSVTQVKMADGIAADNIVENYLNFYSLYMTYIEDTLSSADSLSIMALAGLCPEQNGTVVYQARALYSVIYSDLSVFNDDSCITVDSTYIGERHSSPQSGAVAQNNGGQVYKLFPNPNNGNFILSQLIPDTQPVKADIWDAVGRNIYKQSMTFVSATNTLQLGNISPGVYLLKLTDNNGRNFIFKFTVE